ncbi:MAG: NUDIX domain-containing protein [Candidatus Thorarchaeota archaeon]|jgi:8-oxo-dGTP diphosphatase
MSYHRIGKGGERFWGKKGAGIFFTNGEEVLLLKRSKKTDNGGTWGLPGGTAKEGETNLGTATRETREECGTMQGKRFDSLSENSGHHNWTTFFYKVGNPFDCKLSDEHTDYKWVPFDKIGNYTLHPKLQDNWDRHERVVEKHFKNKMSFREWMER